MTISRFPIVQHGSTVVIALTMLLAMTLVAVSMMDSAILQEQMAGNSRQKTVSRYAAEAALIEAEKMILTKNFGVTANMAPLFDNAAKGYYSAVNLSSDTGISKTATPVDFDITDMSAWDNNVNSIAVDGVIDNAITAKAPQYIIEYIGRQQPDSVSVQSLNNETMQPKISYFFRVVAIGWGKDPEIYTILQSTYRLNPPVAVDDALNQAETMTTAAKREHGRISWSIVY